MKKLLILIALAACSHFPDTSEISSNATYTSIGYGGGTSGTGDRSATFSPAANTLLVAFASVSGNTQTAPTMTDNQGGTYTLVGQAYWSGGSNNMFAFVRDSLVATKISTKLTLDTDTNTAGEIEILAFTGMTKTGAAAVRQIYGAGNQTPMTEPTVFFTSNVNSSDPTITAVASADVSGLGSVPATGWSERKDTYQSSPTTGLETATKDSGFSGSTITYAATTDTSYAVMGIELDTSTGSPPPVDAGVDSAIADASHDASTPDAAPDAAIADASPIDAGPPTWGVHGMIEQIYGMGSNPAQITRDTQASGSTFIVLSAGNTSDVNRGPTDNKGNTYTKLDGVDYSNWPGSGAYVWIKKNATGGSSTTWSQYVTDLTENVTFAIEVPNAGATPTVIESLYQHDNSGVYQNYLDGYLQCPGDAPGTHHCVSLTSGSVTTTGPATLIAFWLGAGATQYGNHVVWPNNGFTTLDGYGIDNPNGLVQGFMAAKTVTSAGTYNVTWTYKPPQGAILYLIAVQP